MHHDRQATHDARNHAEGCGHAAAGAVEVDANITESVAMISPSAPITLSPFSFSRRKSAAWVETVTNPDSPTTKADSFVIDMLPESPWPPAESAVLGTSAAIWFKSIPPHRGLRP
jgi:hypothetical protein